MKNTMEQTVNEAGVSRVAYQLWEKAGCPAGRDLEFWLAAEAEVRNSSKQVVARTNGEPAAAAQVEKPRATRPARNGNGVKKTWPKPYPNLPKF